MSICGKPRSLLTHCATNPSQPIQLKYQPVFSLSVISKAMNEAASTKQPHKKKKKKKKKSIKKDKKRKKRRKKKEATKRSSRVLVNGLFAL